MVRIARFHRADPGSSPGVGSSLTTLIKIVQNKMWVMVKGKRDKMFTRGEHGIAGLAQSVERRAFNLVVVGSIPTVGILQNFRSKNINGFTQQYNSFHY